MRADDVYAILKGKIAKLTEDVKEVGDWKPIRHQGTVQTAEDLPADAKEGYMYNIATDSIYGAAGMNVVKTADGWDPMGPIVNMNLYLSKEEAKKSYQPTGDYPTKEEVKQGYQPAGSYLSGTDEELTVSGKAADAAAVGNAVAKIENINYAERGTLEDTDTFLINDGTGLKKSVLSKLSDFILDKIDSKVFDKLQTNNKTVLGAINELNSTNASDVNTVVSDIAKLTFQLQLKDLVDSSDMTHVAVDSIDSADSVTIISGTYADKKVYI